MRCKYCASELFIKTLEPGIGSPFLRKAPALICPTCDSHSKVEKPPRSILGFGR